MAAVARKFLPGSHFNVLKSGAIAVFYKSTQLVDFDESLAVLRVHREHPRVKLFCKDVERSLRDLTAANEPKNIPEPSKELPEDKGDEMTLDF